MPERFDNYPTPEEVEIDPVQEIKNKTINALSELFLTVSWETIELDNWTMTIEYTEDLEGGFKAVMAFSDKEGNVLEPMTLTSEWLMSVNLLDLWMTKEIAEDWLLIFDKKMNGLINNVRSRLSILKEIKIKNQPWN